jgi:hypothetical protein
LTELHLHFHTMSAANDPLSNPQAEMLAESLARAGSKSLLEEYTHEHPVYPNPLEIALCRREDASVRERRASVAATRCMFTGAGEDNGIGHEQN